MNLAGQPVVAFIPTTDYDTSRAFYTGTLGLEFVANDAFAIVLRSGSVTIRVVKIPDFKPAQYTILGWSVEDIRAAVSHLAGRGVVFERYGFFEQDELGIWKSPDGTSVAWFRDPDGNVLSLSQQEE